MIKANGGRGSKKPILAAPLDDDNLSKKEKTSKSNDSTSNP